MIRKGLVDYGAADPVQVVLAGRVPGSNPPKVERVLV
jgi:hypothetical protein